MIVRNATVQDMPAIVEMARAFYKTTSYAGFADLRDYDVEDLAFRMMDTGTMLVADTGDAVVGMVGLMVVPFMFNRALRTAHEVVWWVDPRAQGLGVGKALLLGAESACRRAGAVAMQMIHLENSPPQAAALYERAGYRYSESCYTKEL